ncbi:MAG: amidohydrolase [Deltaproteobacteria bacterium]|nr:amidohydrolase [Deltaproteobacteria bacterium]MBW2339370.1 amidohydrolase [Deltaproteobacteria bacterium]
MIVDTHVHLVMPGFVKGKFLMGNARMASNIYNRVHKTNITPSQYVDLMKERVDPDCSKLIETMDAAGIDKSVIFGVDWAYAVTGEPRVTNREQNRIHADMAKKWEGRLISLAALDPRRPDIIEQATEAIEEWGMRGFKLHPSAGFYPNDPVCFPLYEKCADWGVPIVFHSGGIEFNWEYGQPIYIASAAEHFPEVKMVMSHAGLESCDQARLAATVLANVYVDISIRQLDYRVNRQKFYSWLREFIDWAGPWKMLFASDTPMPTFWVPQNEWVQAIKDPDTDVPFSREELDIIMGKAAQAVFGIED